MVGFVWRVGVYYGGMKNYRGGGGGGGTSSTFYLSNEAIPEGTSSEDRKV